MAILRSISVTSSKPKKSYFLTLTIPFLRRCDHSHGAIRHRLDLPDMLNSAARYWTSSAWATTGSLMQIDCSTDLAFRSEAVMKPLYEAISREAQRKVAAGAASSRRGARQRY